MVVTPRRTMENLSLKYVKPWAGMGERTSHSWLRFQVLSMAIEDRRHVSPCRLTAGATLLVVAAVIVSVATGVAASGDGSSRPAFVSSGPILLSAAKRASRAPRSRRHGCRRLGMQQQQDGELPAEAEVATEAEEPPRATGKFGFPELPTVFPPRRPKNYKLEKGQVGVRFINTSGDPDVCVGAYPGEMVTKVAKRAGVKIATACNSGLCGTCSTDLEDKNGKSYRPGFQIIRACCTPVTLLPGTDEMVLDTYRNRSKKGNLNKQLTSGDDDIELYAETLTDAMKRFEEGWEDDFVPNYMGGSGPVEKPKDHVKKQFGKPLDPDTIRRTIDFNAQKRMENKYMYDDLPESVRRTESPMGGRELEARLDAARQLDIRMRLSKEKRERTNYYLDNTDRPIANTAQIMSLSQEEVDSRSRFFNTDPDTWDQAYGAANLPEVDREIVETDGRRSEGVTTARMALYRSARQIPRYRFFGDPPLREQDEEYLNRKASQPMDYIDYEQAAELDRLDVITGEVAEDKNNFIFRDSRTGRPVVPHKAGKPGTLRSELRTKPLATCVACEGTGLQECQQCRALGVSAAATGIENLLCPKCEGRSKIPCRACAGSGVGPRGRDY